MLRYASKARFHCKKVLLATSHIVPPRTTRSSSSSSSTSAASTSRLYKRKLREYKRRNAPPCTQLGRYLDKLGAKHELVMRGDAHPRRLEQEHELRKIIALYEDHGLFTRSYLTLLDKHGTEILDMDAQQFVSVIRLLKKLGVRQRPVNAIACMKHGEHLYLLAAHGVEKLEKTAAMVAHELGEEFLLTAALKHSLFLREDPDNILAAVTTLKEIFSDDVFESTCKAYVAKYPRMLTVGADKLRRSYQFFVEFIYQGDAEAAQRRLSETHIHMLQYPVERLRDSFEAFTQLLGEEETRSMVQVYPQGLKAKSTRLLGVGQTLRDLNYEPSVVIRRRPALASRAPQKIKETFRWLSENIGEEAALSSPSLLAASVERNFQPTFDALRDAGVTAEDIRPNVRVLSKGLDTTIRPILRLLNFMRLDFNGKQFVRLVSSIRASDFQKIAKQLDIGIEPSEDDVWKLKQKFVTRMGRPV